MTLKNNIHLYKECTGAHSHEYAQILVPVQKNMPIQIGDTMYDVSPQELCFIPPETMHQCNFYVNLMVINLPDTFSESDDISMITYPLIVSMKGQIIKLIEIIQNELDHNPESTSVRHLYKYLISKIKENCSAPSIRYINEFYNLPITVDQLAKIENYNITYYNDWFKQKTGLSPSFYLRSIRVNKAKELLVNTRYSVMEIAIMVGYSSNSTFTRAFHHMTGMTPKAYRDCDCFKKQTV